MTKLDFKAIAGGVTAAKGFTAAGVCAGIKYEGKKDLALVLSETPAFAAGVFTTNRVKAAPLLVTMENLAKGCAQVVVVNSGNANACNGERGMRDARLMAEETARLTGSKAGHVIVASTGVIGQPLPIEKILKGIGEAVLKLSPNGGNSAAKAIMTTDTVLKEYAVKFNLHGFDVILGGMAKGAGMIHPDMATMLCFLTTDAAIEPGILKKALKYACKRSFNMISVDGDTSTNDMAVIMANSKAGNPIIQNDGEEYLVFRDALVEVCTNLAVSIAADGEGSTKLIEVCVIGAPSEEDAGRAARAVAASNLVKTAIAGEDANWGRIICAVGYSGAVFDPQKVDIYLGKVQVAMNGQFLDFDEGSVQSYLSGGKIKILIDFKSGSGKATAWGCDLTCDYVKINADYRT